MTLSMPIPLLFCAAIGAILVYLPFMVVGLARVQLGYDQSAPRAMFDKLPAYAKRATWAHQNSFEAYSLFAPAVLLAYVTTQESNLALGAAVVHLVARVFYSVFYILDKPLLRSLMFAIGGLGTFTLFFLSCRSALV